MSIGAELINALPSLPTAFLLLIVALSTIATSAIGINAMNKNTDYKKDHKIEDDYLIVNLIVAILAALVAFIGMLHSAGLF